MTFYVIFSNFIAIVHKETHSINLLTQRMTNLSTLIQNNLNKEYYLHVLLLSTIHVSTKMMSVCTHLGYYLIIKCRDINY